jgi:hypothetical protein
MNQTIGFLVKRVDINPFDFMAKQTQVWDIIINEDTFATYKTKKEAIEDAKKYNIKIINK